MQRFFLSMAAVSALFSGCNMPTAMVIEEAIDKFAFALWNMGFAKLPNP
ncbi:MAG: hypothetical protein RLZZ02_955 [Bacteroidota bacterium]|jgi:hypothetical protein